MLRCFFWVSIILIALISSIFIVSKKNSIDSKQIITRGEESKSSPDNLRISQNDKVSLNVPEHDASGEEFFFPADELDSIIGYLGAEADYHIELKQFEADLRSSLASGWTPPWQNIAPKLTRKECSKMSTLELAEVCFSSSVYSRELLIFDKPIFGFKRLKILYPCFAEFFERDDLWNGVISAYTLYSSQLNPQGETNANIDALMGLDNLPRVYQLPELSEQLDGKEYLFIQAHLESLIHLRTYIENDRDDSTVSSTPFFSITTPIALINTTLAFMDKASPNKASEAINEITKFRLPQKTNMGQIKNYMDTSIKHIEEFLSAN